jgi:hypothetical protein
VNTVLEKCRPSLLRLGFEVDSLEILLDPEKSDPLERLNSEKSVHGDFTTQILLGH